MKTNALIRKILRFGLGVLLALAIAGLPACSACPGCGSNRGGLSDSLFRFNHRVRGSGKLAQETRDLGNFSGVILSEEGDLNIEIGDQEQITIEAEDNLLEYLVAEINDGSLEIKKSPENLQLVATRPIRYLLKVRSLNTLIVKNSGEVEITEVDSLHFKLRISGSGGVRINRLAVKNLEVAITGSGDLTIAEGSANRQSVHLNSSGGYDGKNVVSQLAQINLSSSGEAIVNVQETLVANTTSSGNVYYLGNPPHVSIPALTSSGRVVRYWQ